MSSSTPRVIACSLVALFMSSTHPAAQALQRARATTFDELATRSLRERP
jgi:hypothetical protein